MPLMMWPGDNNDFWRQPKYQGQTMWKFPADWRHFAGSLRVRDKIAAYTNPQFPWIQVLRPPPSSAHHPAQTLSPCLQAHKAVRGVPPGDLQDSHRSPHPRRAPHPARRVSAPYLAHGTAHGPLDLARLSRCRRRARKLRVSNRRRLAQPFAVARTDIRHRFVLAFARVQVDILPDDKIVQNKSREVMGYPLDRSVERWKRLEHTAYDIGTIELHRPKYRKQGATSCRPQGKRACRWGSRTKRRSSS